MGRSHKTSHVHERARASRIYISDTPVPSVRNRAITTIMARLIFPMMDASTSVDFLVRQMLGHTLLGETLSTVSRNSQITKLHVRTGLEPTQNRVANQNRWNVKEGSRCGTNGAGTCTASGTCQVVLQYSWQTGAWGDCSSPCGSAGTQSRTVICVDQAGSTVSDSNCDAGSKPAESQVCNTQSCPQWTIGSFGACSAACGGGTKSRSVVCTEDGTTVADTICTNCNGNGCPGTKPAATEACNTASCPTFSTGPWSSCEFEGRSVFYA